MKRRSIFHRTLSPVEQGKNDMQFSQRPGCSMHILLGILSFICVAVGIVLSIRLFQLTIVKGSYYRRLAEENRLREYIVEQQRGLITDRRGEPIADSIPADMNSHTERIYSVRRYPMASASAHLVGYRQIASSSDLKHDACLSKLILGDRIGKQGVEQLYECELRGKQGIKLIEIDARSAFLKELSVDPPVSGIPIQLTVDAGLQRLATSLLTGKKGAVVALEPHSGAVLALVSAPSFEPALFESGDPLAQEYFVDPEKPLFNRATEATYPPGSVFKLVVASTALEEHAITASTLIEDTGSITAGPIKFGNWYFLQYGKTDGMVDVIKGIRRSNDIFFYRIAEKAGPLAIRQWADRFGYGKITGIGIDEKEGLIPSPFWKKETLKEQWYLGDTYNISIGQGYTLVTPLQVTQATAVFAQDGKICTPQLRMNAKPACSMVPISKETIRLVREGMKGACSTGGTGWPFFDFTISDALQNKQKITVGCKTGTAESLNKKTEPHAWFTVFAPFDDPKIVLTVLVEEGGEGSDVAAPIARDLIRLYLEQNP